MDDSNIGSDAPNATNGAALTVETLTAHTSNIEKGRVFNIYLQNKFTHMQESLVVQKCLVWAGKAVGDDFAYVACAVLFALWTCAVIAMSIWFTRWLIRRQKRSRLDMPDQITNRHTHNLQSKNCDLSTNVNQRKTQAEDFINIAPSPTSTPMKMSNTRTHMESSTSTAALSQSPKLNRTPERHTTSSVVSLIQRTFSPRKQVDKSSQQASTEVQGSESTSVHVKQKVQSILSTKCEIVRQTDTEKKRFSMPIVDNLNEKVKKRMSTHEHNIKFEQSEEDSTSNDENMMKTPPNKNKTYMNGQCNSAQEPTKKSRSGRIIKAPDLYPGMVRPDH